ncbi:MAG: U32 family peptidase, partial [Deltaproteobacteria bacterium]|nr:U32 family peptidase [Deltaproteobacteria bacterium]
PCVGNREYDLLAKEEMLTQLKWASDQGIAAVTVAGAFLMELVAHHLPHLKVIVSSSAFVDSLEKTRQFATLGADAVTLHPDANRSMPLLRQLRDSSPCRIRLVVNSGCAFQCVHGQFHALANGHFAADAPPADAWPGDDEKETGAGGCNADFTGDPEAFVRMRWIRPEDLGAYSALGFSDFVIAGQGRPTAWIASAIAAFRRGLHEGDLLPLLDGGVRLMGLAGGPHSLHTGGMPNLLMAFEDVNCRLGCDHCSRCTDLATIAVLGREEAR